MSSSAKLNLRLEATTGCIFLIFVLLVGLLGLLAVNWVGSEIWAPKMFNSVTDQVIFNPQAFLAVGAMLLIPVVLVGLAILGIRSLLVQPELPPWEG